MHGLSPFSNKFAIKFLKNSFCPRCSNMVILKLEVLNFLVYLLFESFLCCITVNVYFSMCFIG